MSSGVAGLLDYDMRVPYVVGVSGVCVWVAHCGFSSSKRTLDGVLDLDLFGNSTRFTKFCKSLQN